MKTEDMIREVRRLRRMLWTTVLDHPPPMGDLEAALAPLAERDVNVRTALSRWKLLGDTELGRQRRRELAEHATGADHYDRRIGLLVELTRRRLESSSDPGDVAQLHTTRFLWHGLLTQRNTLIEKHLGLVRLAVATTGARTDLRDDLMHEGVLGLMRGIRNFDVDRGVRFSTYAMYWIHTFVRRAKARQEHTVRVPEHVYAMANKIRRVRRAAEQQGASASAALAKAGISSVEAMRAEASRATSYEVLDANARADGDDLSELVDRAIQIDRMRDLFSDLDARERYVLEHRFELHGRSRVTFEVLGESMGLSREGVRQIQLRALDRLRRGLTNDQARGPSPPA